MNVPLCIDHVFLKNCSANFDETLHVVWACTEEGFKIGGMYGYSPVQFLEPKNCPRRKCPDVRICPYVRQNVRICVHIQMSGFLFMSESDQQ